MAPPEGLIGFYTLRSTGEHSPIHSPAATASCRDDAELAAVLAFIRNSWGNDDKKKNGSTAGGTVTPADVARVVARPNKF